MSIVDILNILKQNCLTVLPLFGYCLAILMLFCLLMTLFIIYIYIYIYIYISHP